MLYPVIVHKDENSIFGITVPDLPGVFAFGETLDMALGDIQGVVEEYFDGAAAGDVAAPSRLETVLSQDIAQGGAVMLVDIDFGFMDKTTVPVNISMPLYMRNRIDHYAKARGLSRSAYMVKAAEAFA